MIELIAKEYFYAAENGINTRLYVTDEIIKTDSKEFAELLIKKGHAKLDEKLETKVIEVDEVKTTTKARGLKRNSKIE
jgi:hypothetical protein